MNAYACVGAHASTCVLCISTHSQRYHPHTKLQDRNMFSGIIKIMWCVTWPEKVPSFSDFMESSFARTSPTKRNYMIWKTFWKSISCHVMGYMTGDFVLGIYLVKSWRQMALCGERKKTQEWAKRMDSKGTLKKHEVISMPALAKGSTGASASPLALGLVLGLSAALTFGPVRARALDPPDLGATIVQHALKRLGRCWCLGGGKVHRGSW